ncbi:MAG: hypothetical protein KF861_24640, partial [Planctomycetaceae bacterium]|nr:hypothetical protein [Planctomycetaceae bacterium]
GGEAAFLRRPAMLGQVYLFADDPFPGTPHDWAWFLRSVPPEHRDWSARHGISARQGSDEFLKFLIPSVRGVPVLSFLLLITLFTIVIGPLNYVWLWKKRRLYLLVLTIPVLALGTSLALLAYSSIAHGFSTRSRARTLTMVDQRSNTAVSIARLSLFSGIAPTGGLQFSPETAVYPIWPRLGGFTSGSVDWTERQALPGWLESRTRTQYLTVAHRDERGRLQVAPPTDGRMKITNGFEWTLEAVVVSDAAGELYFGKHIAAGAAAELTPLQDEQRTEFTSLLRQSPLVAPSTSGESSDIFSWNFDPYSRYGENVPVRYESSMVEMLFADLQHFRWDGAPIPPGAYAAAVAENPGIEFGVEKTRPEDSLHVLFGTY